MKKLFLMLLLFSHLECTQMAQKKPEVLNEQKEQEYYTEPGAITNQNGIWIGSDDVNNLPKTIYFLIQRIRSTGNSFIVDKDKIAKDVEAILKKGGMNPVYLSGGPGLPFPYLNILITTIPYPDGKVVAIDVRLFESITLDRDPMPEGIYWQGMTWERTIMVQDTNDKIADRVYDTINQIIQSFVQEVKHANATMKSYQ